MSFFKPAHNRSSANDSNRSSNTPFFRPQAKLRVGEANDKYEKEADAVADKVVHKGDIFGNTEPFFKPAPKLQRSPDTEQEVQKSEETEQIQEKPILESITPLIQRKDADVEPVQLKEDEEPVQMMEDDSEVQKQESENEVTDSSIQGKEIGATPQVESSNIQRKEEEIQQKEEEIQEKESEEDNVQRKGVGGGNGSDESIQQSGTGNSGDTSSLESNLASSKGGGNSMDSGTKDQMESGFGTDFSGVKIHNDANAVQMNKELGSHAFANGNDIYFNEGKYNPSSKEGQHLLAHELTHTVQQGASTQPAVQKAAATAEPADAPALKPTTPLDITHKLNITEAWAKYLDAENEKKAGPREVDVKIGERYSGTIELSRKKGTDTGELARYEITNGTKKNFLKINGWNFLQPLRDAGAEPVLVLNKFGDEQITTGFLSVAIKDIAIGNAKGFIESLNENLDKMGFLGVSPITIADGFVNEFSAGRLIFQVGAMKTVVDGYLEAGGGMGITGDVFTFNVNASIDVAGLASGEFMIARAEDGSFAGSADIEADIANVNAKIHVEYINGAVTIQGTGKIQSEKFSGEITLLVTDKARSGEMMNAALGVESMDAEKETAESPAAAPVPKSKNNQVLAGWGEVTANITPWLTGTAKVGIDSEGHVTIVGEISVDDEVELMEQRGKKVDLFKVEIKAGYGIPLVGQVFLFASIGMFMNAGFGPLVLKGIGFKGTYSTDPNILQEFEITGTLGINAFAIIGLEAEAGVGVTILGHDLKAGVNVTAAAGLRAYAEATPTLQYKEQASPEGGKVGESRLKGHFEAAAQLFMQLSGSLFYELDSPWWSPAPDGREDFPLGEVQYPIGDSMGIGADMDWLIGSDEAPELKFSPVEFDPDKFTADVMADPPPRKSGKSETDEAGEWVDGNKPGDQKDNPEMKDGEGLPDTGKKKEDLKKLPDEQKYMRSLDEMSKLEKADPKPTFAVAKAKAAKVKSKYALDTITVTDKGELAEVFVKHAKESNKDHKLEVPLMSAAERYKLLKVAMDDLKAKNAKAGGEAGTVTEDEAKELISAWQKAHPVVEETRVVDGGATWDYFIDIGDKSETEKGKAKKGAEPVINPSDQASDEVKPYEFEMNKHKHTLIWSQETIWMESVRESLVIKINAAKRFVDENPNAELIKGKQGEVSSKLGALKLAEQSAQKKIKQALARKKEGADKNTATQEANAEIVKVANDIQSIGDTYKLIDLQSQYGTEEFDGELLVGLHPLSAEGRESHHVAENKFMEQIKAFYGEIGSTLSTNPTFQDIGEKLITRQAGIEGRFKDGANLSAILIHADTHRLASESAVHSINLQPHVMPGIKEAAETGRQVTVVGIDSGTGVKRAQMSEGAWNSFIKKVYEMTNANEFKIITTDQNLVVESKDSDKEALKSISALLNSELSGADALEGRELKLKKSNVLKQINDTAKNAYNSALTTGLQTVKAALTKSDVDGNEADHPKALDKLKALANKIWLNNIVHEIK